MINEKTQQTTKTLVPSPKSLDELQLFTMPEGGMDQLNFITWDTIELIGQGEEVVEFHGYYMIDRANPTSADWAEASVDIRMHELNVDGVSKSFGRIHASVNPDLGKISGGQVRPGTTYTAPDSPKLCQMYGYMQFDLQDVGITVFNKEPIVLEHNITHIPPVGQGGGTKERVDIPLYRKDDPDGDPVAILHRVKTHIGSWLKK
ncbi:DUF6073 family protein [Dictyobacter aurantiacus]|uniref:Uncharacterized protein n=1 Tax=Dictyobacter aurantiacus TaxID=1936993 RepID=A0A401ZLJ2_9CHLR|nr:DUF6073 family protein [Dictyobacter aurantiacus]GCE07690.1 hypothetical protein KDAU_50190 [Dictyobacter aurantiacus]